MRSRKLLDGETPIFVSRATAAKRLEISVDTFDAWVRDKYVPGPAVTRGQVRRWHWPSVEEALKPSGESEGKPDPYMTGVQRGPKGNTRSAA